MGVGVRKVWNETEGSAMCQCSSTHICMHAQTHSHTPQINKHIHYLNRQFKKRCYPHEKTNGEKGLCNTAKRHRSHPIIHDCYRGRWSSACPVTHLKEIPKQWKWIWLSSQISHDAVHRLHKLFLLSKCTEVCGDTSCVQGLLQQWRHCTQIQ